MVKNCSKLSYMQLKRKLKNQTWENGEKPIFSKTGPILVRLA